MPNNKYDNIKKYYCQLVLLKPKLIVINISIYNTISNILGSGTNFLLKVY